jgi:hypothetical protein
MYWPNGVPRVYAVNGPCIRLPPEDVLEENRDEVAQDNGDHTSSGGEGATTNPRSVKTEEWANEAINGLCASRSGHLFSTMTKSSISIWQTRVGQPCAYQAQLLTDA